MNNKTKSPLIFLFFPLLVLIPITIQIIINFHMGGIETFLSFFRASISPSLNIIVLSNVLNGLLLTIAIALISWLISMISGIFLGLISSNIFWQVICNKKYIGVLIRRFLCIPRSIHEVIWGLFLLQIFGLNPLIAVIAIVIPHSSLISRVVADQMDTINQNTLFAIKQSGASSVGVLITALFPPLIPVLTSYGAYRIECCIRGATLLGIFGLGGIGTEMKLTFQSLEFNELWTSLWLLGITIFILESVLNWLRNYKNFKINKLSTFCGIILFLFLFYWSVSMLNIEPLKLINIRSLGIPSFSSIKIVFNEIEILKLTLTTILITLLSAGLAIGLPPLTLMIWHEGKGIKILNFFWLFFRLMPPPLTALLLLLCINPCLSLASISIGITSMGVMGRLLKDLIENQNDLSFEAIQSTGATEKLSWLYGKLSPQSRSYLAFAAYRADVLLRDTALIGVVGGMGLGWQLQESLSSFDWNQVIVITFTFVALTFIGETISDNSRKYWLGGNNSNSSPNLIF